MKIVLASRNKHKIEEWQATLGKFIDGVEMLSLDEVGIFDEIEEDGKTFEENALIKARAAAKSGYIGIGEDSGLSVNALGGEPGIYSARYGFDDSLDDWGRLLLLLKNTEHVPDGQRQAKFVCVISFVHPNGQVIQARGEIHGELLRQTRGENGFGYDPIFYYPPLNKSTAELSPEEKDIDYQYDFSFELGSQRFPTAHRPNWCRFIHNLGEDLFRMMED